MSTAVRRQAATAPRRGASAWRRHRWALGPLLALVVFGGPTLLLHLVVRSAAACFEAIPARREEALPDCARRAAWLEPLEGLPFIGRPALRAREEIVARMAVWRYLDAAVGAPDRAAQAERIEPLWDAELLFLDGSGRLRMDEVGPSMPVPEPGQLAFSAGDRPSLDRHGLRWHQHYSAIRALEAVLLEGRVERAVQLAQSYAGRGPSDLRLRVAALLCIGGEPGEGVEQIVEEERFRAAERTANFTRNFGELRVVIERCADLGELAAPPPPLESYAGAWDQRARLAVIRLRQVRRRFPGCDLADSGCRANPLVAADVADVLERLGAREPEPHRLALLAEGADALGAAEALELGVPRQGEPAWSARDSAQPDVWLRSEPDAPFVPAARYQAAAARLARLAPGELTAAIQALEVHAAMGYAQAGSLAQADACLDRAGRGEPFLAAAVALLAGDRAQARERAARGDSALPRLALLRAELALPDRAAAEEHARAALAGDDEATAERARWLLLSLGQLTRGRELVSTPGALPPRYRVVGPPTLTVAAEERERALDDALGQLHVWLRGDNLRASRYALLAERGDAPAAFAAWLHYGAQLSSRLDQTEIWLDALMAFDARRFSLRQVAFARWQAAEWRADAEAAALWRSRYLDLARRSQEPAHADLFQTLGL